MRKVMISQPMHGRDKIDILNERDIYKEKLENLGYEVVNSFFDFATYTKHRSLYLLGKSLEVMSDCDAVFFVPGWENADGCKIERQCAELYGLEII